ncbi:zinc ribbon domain-containing protein, partial [Parasutterella excrementihominis]
LSGWMRGYLQERIRYKAKKHGIEVSEVNPAYSSRECPRCHCTDKKTDTGIHLSARFAGTTDMLTWLLR